MTVVYVTVKGHAEGYVINIYFPHYMEVINTLLFFINFHDSPVHLTSQSMINYFAFSEN